MPYIDCVCSFCSAGIRRKHVAHVVLHFCNRTCKANYQRLAKPVSKEWLEREYVTNGRDCTDIAREVGRDPKSVWNWLKDLGIPTRKRGSYIHKVKPRRPPGWKHSEETKAKIRLIAIAQGRVPYDPKVGSYMKGKKGAETTNWKGGITPERQAFYGTREWKSAAHKVKKRDRYTCQRCGKKKAKGDGEEFDIHHIVPFECRELRAEVSNLVYLCESCHYWVHSKKNRSKKFIKEIPSVK